MPRLVGGGIERMLLLWIVPGSSRPNSENRCQSTDNGVRYTSTLPALEGVLFFELPVSRRHLQLESLSLVH